MRFVVHQHHATGLHWDFRLEAEDGTLKSWAVPKGPSLDPGAKRLAMRTEDHALDHIGFEGVIGQGHVGGGPVIIWDEGTYLNVTSDRRRGSADLPSLTVVDAVDAGHVSVALSGHKLTGGFAITRTGTEPRERWILVKKRDAYADPSLDVVADRPESVRSGLRIDQLGQDRSGPAG